MKTLNEKEIKYLEYASNIMWGAMQRLIKKENHSDFTFNLEGSVHTINSILERVNCENEPKTLSKNEIEDLECASRFAWEAMLRLILLDGYSDFTLYLEGSARDINSIVERLRQ